MEVDQELRDKILLTYDHVETLVKNEKEIFTRVGDVEKIQAVHTEKIKTHSRFIIGSFSLSSISGVVAGFLGIGKG